MTDNPHNLDSGAHASGLSADTTVSFGSPERLDDTRARTGLSAEEAVMVRALPDGSALLIAQSGAGMGSRFLLDTESTVAGRGEQSDIFLDDVTVSRRHAEFTRQGTVFSVSDIGSLNGTYVNGARIDRQPLTNGDVVQIGKFRLTFFERPIGLAAGE